MTCSLDLDRGQSHVTRVSMTRAGSRPHIRLDRLPGGTGSRGEAIPRERGESVVAGVGVDASGSSRRGGSGPGNGFLWRFARPTRRAGGGALLRDVVAGAPAAPHRPSYGLSCSVGSRPVVTTPNGPGDESIATTMQPAAPVPAPIVHRARHARLSMGSRSAT